MLPTGAPLSSHWYTGAAPPLVGVAVKVTEVLAQTGFAEGETDTDTGAAGMMTTVTTLDVSGDPVTQATLDVITTFTWSLSLNAVLL